MVMRVSRVARPPYLCSLNSLIFLSYDLFFARNYYSKELLQEILCSLIAHGII